MRNRPAMTPVSALVTALRFGLEALRVEGVVVEADGAGGATLTGVDTATLEGLRRLLGLADGVRLTRVAPCAPVSAAWVTGPAAPEVPVRVEGLDRGVHFAYASGRTATLLAGLR